jgi:hypothetical protein
MSDRQPPRGLSPIDLSTFVFAALAVKDGKRTPAEFRNDLAGYADKEGLRAAFDALVAAGKAQVNAAGKAALTDDGKREAQQRFGKLPGGKAGMMRLKNVVWPALALGLEPASKAAARLSTPDNLRATLLVSLFQLPLDKSNATMPSVVSALVLRGLAGADLRAADQPELKALAQTAGDLSDADKLRQSVVRAALALNQSGAAKVPSAGSQTCADAAFAKSVQALANRLSTPPFSHKVAIAQVYDAYGREHRDAGSLESFKGKLLSAHHEGLVNLRALDEPQAMDGELRERSLIKTDYGWYYFVSRG